MLFDKHHTYGTNGTYIRICLQEISVIQSGHRLSHRNIGHMEAHNEITDNQYSNTIELSFKSVSI